MPEQFTDVEERIPSTPAAPAEVIDPDIDLHDPAQRQELAATHRGVLAVISIGGGVGALARYGLLHALPTQGNGFPWATLVANVSGCLLIGVLMVVITEVRSAHPLLRPLLGVGVLGGFTTFSTYSVETHALLRPGMVGLAGVYLVATLVGSLVAVTIGVVGTRGLLGRVRGVGE